MPAAALALLLLAAGAAAAASRPDCVVVRDTASGQDVRMEAHGANAVRVRAVPSGGAFLDDPDVVSAFTQRPTPGTATLPAADAGECATVELGAAGSSVASGNLLASVGSDGKLSFTRVSDSKVLLTEKDVRTLAPTTTVPPLPGFFSVGLSFEAVEAERIYGLGQHAAFSWDPDFPAALDQKGVPAMLLEPHDGDVTIPVAHSSLGYVFLSNLPSTGTVEYNSSGSFWRHDAALQVDLWIATTSDSPPHAISPWRQLQRAYADATGHAPVYPDWATGFWQCKLRYANQSQVMEVVNGYIDRDIPISLIIIDFFNWNDPSLPKDKQSTLGDETLPKTCWPDAKLMVDQLKELGVELMISPYSHSVAKTSTNYAEAEAKALLATNRSGQPALGFSGGYVYDLFNPAARAFAWAAMQKGYVDQYGLHHWWLDCDEPCGGTNNGSFATEWLYNSGKWPAAFVGAAYPQMLELAIWEGMGAPGKPYEHDNVMLGRAGWAGSQKYGGAIWSGDTKSTWADFNHQFRAGLNMVMSGLPYWTTDIGGFGGGNTSDPGFRELLVRWFQWGAFCPLFRLHGDRAGPTWPPAGSCPSKACRDGTFFGQCGGTASNEVWMFGNESEAAIVKVMRMREQLRPYVMAQYEAASIDGTPIMRPLFFDFHTDAASQTVDDQQMFGPDYLVAPVLVQGAATRSVYLPPLPKGSVWKNVFTSVETDTSSGGKEITEATPLDTFPLYKRHTPLPYPK